MAPMTPSRGTRPGSGNLSSAKPSSEDAAKRLDERAQQLFERLGQQRTGTSGKAEPSGSPSGVDGDVGITHAPMTTPSTERSTGDGIGDTAKGDSVSGMAGSATSSQQQQYQVRAGARILAAAALITAAGILLLVRRRRAI
jgi:hypothetical protein